MQITRLTWTPYRLQFAGAFGTARSNLRVREGVIIRLETDSGLTGLGEAAPLPEFGGGYPADVVGWLAQLAPEITGQPVSTLETQLTGLLDKGGPGAAATACGLETAAFDILAQAANLPLAQWLATFGGSPAKTAAKTVPVNATIGQPDLLAACEAARQAMLAGFRCIKLKVGLANSLAGEVARVEAVRQASGPLVTLRLDANGGWKVRQAIEILQALEQFDLELIEQPVAAADLTGLAEVRRQVKIPIAADEPVTGVAAARAIIAAGAADFLVIKPMVVGGLRAGLQIIELAQAAGLGCFVTTTIDSGVGIAAALHLAANLAVPIPYCGLATAALLTGSLVQQVPPVEGGQMIVPTRPGLGVDLLFKDTARPGQSWPPNSMT
jgi:L-Ala-D/L-Glu epimerase